MDWTRRRKRAVTRRATVENGGGKRRDRENSRLPPAKLYELRLLWFLLRRLFRSSIQAHASTRGLRTITTKLDEQNPRTIGAPTVEIKNYMSSGYFFFQRFILRIFLNYCSDVCVSDLSHQYLQVNFSYHEAREQNLTNKDSLVHY